MNCDGFEALINDLAKGVLMEATTRDEALSHGASCRNCEMRLANERELTAGIRKLSTVWSGEPSSQIEAALLVAFREQRVRSSGVAGAARKGPRWVYVAAGAAALAVIVLMLSLTISRTRSSHELQTPQRAGAEPSAASSQKDGRAKPDAPPDIKQRVASNGAPAVNTIGLKKARSTQRRPRVQDDTSADGEIATEFFPLNRDGIGQIDSAQVVRVELPRSAMMSFGLPINMDRADERIKADVVVGNDGMARAIRFVR